MLVAVWDKYRNLVKNNPNNNKGKPIFGKYNQKIENPILVANLEKVNNLLKWQPKTDIVQGIKETINSYGNQQ